MYTRAAAAAAVTLEFATTGELHHREDVGLMERLREIFLSCCKGMEQRQAKVPGLELSKLSITTGVMPAVSISTHVCEPMYLVIVLKVSHVRQSSCFSLHTFGNTKHGNGQ